MVLQTKVNPLALSKPYGLIWPSSNSSAQSLLMISSMVKTYGFVNFTASQLHFFCPSMAYVPVNCQFFSVRWAFPFVRNLLNTLNFVLVMLKADPFGTKLPYTVSSEPIYITVYRYKYIYINKHGQKQQDGILLKL